VHIDAGRGDAAPGGVPGVSHAAIQSQPGAGVAAKPVGGDHQVEPLGGSSHPHHRLAVLRDDGAVPEPEAPGGQGIHERAVQLGPVH